MPSKKSKAIKLPEFRSKAAPDFSEVELLAYGREVGAQLKPGDRLLLEGPMGAGKSTFARAVLEGAGVSRDAEGSPTFPIAHEYFAKNGTKIVHVDFYRLKSESEIEATGLLELFWDERVVILSEWTEQFPEFFASVTRSEFPVAVLELRFSERSASFRRLSVRSHH